MVPREDGKQEVQTLAGEMLVVCATNAEAWRLIDQNAREGQADDERQLRIRQSGPFA